MVEDPEDHGLSFHGAIFDCVARSKGKRPLLRVAEGVRFRGSSRSVLLGKNAGTVALLAGTVDRTENCAVVYYGQHSTDLETDQSAAGFLLIRCEDALAKRAGMEAVGTGVSAERGLLGHSRAALGQFGHEVEVATSVPCKWLSGGQRALLKFALLSLQPSHLLVTSPRTTWLGSNGAASCSRGPPGGMAVATHEQLMCNVCCSAARMVSVWCASMAEW